MFPNISKVCKQIFCCSHQPVQVELCEQQELVEQQDEQQRGGEADAHQRQQLKSDQQQRNNQEHQQQQGEFILVKVVCHWDILDTKKGPGASSKTNLGTMRCFLQICPQCGAFCHQRFQF